MSFLDRPRDGPVEDIRELLLRHVPGVGAPPRLDLLDPRHVLGADGIREFTLSSSRSNVSFDVVDAVRPRDGDHDRDGHDEPQVDEET